jgi:hypothetical protein
MFAIEIPIIVSLVLAVCKTTGVAPTAADLYLLKS